jgi:hypothetical protein
MIRSHPPHRVFRVFVLLCVGLGFALWLGTMHPGTAVAASCTSGNCQTPPPNVPCLSAQDGTQPSTDCHPDNGHILLTIKAGDTVTLIGSNMPDDHVFITVCQNDKGDCNPKDKLIDAKSLQLKQGSFHFSLPNALQQNTYGVRINDANQKQIAFVHLEITLSATPPTSTTKGGTRPPPADHAQADRLAQVALLLTFLSLLLYLASNPANRAARTPLTPTR